MPNTANNPYGLTDLQFRFCQEYVIDFNESQAYLRAGYRGKSKAAMRTQASYFLTKPEILKCIDDLKKKAVEKINVNTKFIDQGLLTIYNRCMQAEPATDSWGNKLPFLLFDPKMPI